jgi:hypothetical protein
VLDASGVVKVWAAERAADAITDLAATDFLPVSTGSTPGPAGPPVGVASVTVITGYRT